MRGGIAKELGGPWDGGSWGPLQVSIAVAVHSASHTVFVQHGRERAVSGALSRGNNLKKSEKHIAERGKRRSRKCHVLLYDPIEAK